MKINLINDIDKEIEFFVNKFKKIGWNQEDASFLTKKVNFPIKHDENDENWENSIGFVMFPSLLYYFENSESKIVPWVQARITIDENKNLKYLEDDPRLPLITNYMKEEFKKIGFKAFYDEDAMNGNFSKPKRDVYGHGFVNFSFYLNKDYPGGYWENHTIE